MIHETAFIHPLARVTDSHIGAVTRVYQFASVVRGAKLGIDCTVGPTATLDGSRFGDRCSIGPGVNIGPGLHFGDDCFIGPNVIVCNDAWPMTSKEGWDVRELTEKGLKVVLAGNSVSVGANATILPGVKIGDGSMIAAGAVVGKDIPPGHLFKRSGEIVPIDTSAPKERMKYVW